jgi:hypothetical protein
LGLLTWLRKSAKSSGAAGMLGAFNELYNPSAHSTQIILEIQKEAIKPIPSPDDKPFKLEMKKPKR